MRAIKKIAILLFALLALFLNGCSELFIRFDKIQLDGYNYNILQPRGEVQPPNEMGESVQVYLVHNGIVVDTKKTYEAVTYADDPEHIFLYFDSVDWVKEGYHDEWTVPHTGH